MSIADIYYDQINFVSGGDMYITEVENQLMRYVLESSVLGNEISKDRIFRNCINVVKKKYGITLCLSKRKPIECTYHLWGMLHDLEEKIPKC